MTIILPDPEPEQPVNLAELRIQRRLTTSFIKTAPVVLVLIPRERVKKPSGGFGWEDLPARVPQLMRLIEPGAIPRPILTVDGVQREVEFELLGEYDALIGKYDTFELDGFHWEIIGLGHSNGWEQRALVAKVG